MNILLYITTVLIWGSSWLAITFQIGETHAITSVAWRFLIAGLILTAIGLWRGWFKGFSFGFANQWPIAMQGLCIFSLNYILFYQATNEMTSGLVAVIFSTIIVMNMVNNAIFFSGKITQRTVIASTFGLIGISIVFKDDVMALGLEGPVLTNLAICLVATLLASWGQMFAMRNQRAGHSIHTTNAIGMLYGAAASFAFAFFGDLPLAMPTSFNYLVAMAYLTIFASCIAFATYFALAKRIGVEKVTYASVLFPMVALALSTLFEGYVWQAHAILGVALILFGNLLILLPEELFRKKEVPA